VKIKLSTTVLPQPHWVELGVRHEEEDAHTIQVLYNREVRLELRRGHYELLALFFTQRTSMAHNPTLLAFAKSFQAVMSGKPQTLAVKGSIPNDDEIEELKELLPLTVRATATQPQPKCIDRTSSGGRQSPKF
jgi:hypothetical protein